MLGHESWPRIFSLEKLKGNSHFFCMKNKGNNIFIAQIEITHRLGPSVADTGKGKNIEDPYSHAV